MRNDYCAGLHYKILSQIITYGLDLLHGIIQEAFRLQVWQLLVIW